MVNTVLFKTEQSCFLASIIYPSLCSGYCFALWDTASVMCLRFILGLYMQFLVIINAVGIVASTKYPVMNYVCNFLVLSSCGIIQQQAG